MTDVFAILKGSSTTKTCTISNDGTVTAGLFAATGVNNTGVEAGSGGLLSVQRGPSSGTSDVFRGYQGATVNARIQVDGAAEFAGGNINLYTNGSAILAQGATFATKLLLELNLLAIIMWQTSVGFCLTEVPQTVVLFGTWWVQLQRRPSMLMVLPRLPPD